MTNADVIRQMTDEEMADSLYLCDKISVDDCEQEDSCSDCRLRWLKQEVSE